MCSHYVLLVTKEKEWLIKIARNTSRERFQLTGSLFFLQAFLSMLTPATKRNLATIRL